MYLPVIVAVTLLSTVSALSLLGNVAFSVGITRNVYLAKKDPVIYNLVFLNAGNGYNNESGVFTAPKDGIYMFTYHFSARATYGAMLSLFKNDVLQVDGYGSHMSNGSTTGGNSVILYLKTGDNVQIKAETKSWVTGDVDPYTVYATFNGFFIGNDITVPGVSQVKSIFHG